MTEELLRLSNRLLVQRLDDAVYNPGAQPSARDEIVISYRGCSIDIAVRGAQAEVSIGSLEYRDCIRLQFVGEELPVWSSIVFRVLEAVNIRLLQIAAVQIEGLKSEGKYHVH